jgi:inorganic pyrophosphatase
MPHAISTLAPFDGEKNLNAVIDTPKDSRNKYTYDEANGLFSLSGVLPAGAVFPFDFGFVPATRGGDGDPLDVLVLMDEAAFVGCVVPARLIGVLEVEQEENGKRYRNDRLIAVAAASHLFKDLRQLDALQANILDEIEHFFRSYNEIKGKGFEVLRRGNAARARRLVERARPAKRPRGQRLSTRRANA